MRIRLIKKQTIEDYTIHNARSRVPFEDFLRKLKYADWEKPTDIKNTFSSADLLGESSNRVVFDIGGNNYRVIGKYYFGDRQVHLFICWIGSHAAYTALCSKGLQYSIYNY